MSLALIPAMPEDLAFIVDVYNSIIAVGEITADTEEVSIEDWQPWFSRHQQPERPVWILHVDEEPCGWMSFSDYYGRPAYEISTEVSIYLAEGFRFRGLGERFLRMGLDHIRQHGVKNVLAFIFTSNRSSVRLFERTGFLSWGVLPKICLLNGTEKDVVILGRRL